MKLSVVMACKDSDPTSLKRSIMSVLNQTYRNFEFIIIDDGSTEPLDNIINSITNDSRIYIYRIEQSGLGAALNFGINKSSGEYIARIDDDDTMCPERLHKQVQYLDFYKDVSCVGTLHYIKVKDKYLPHRRYPIEHKEIIEELLGLRWPMAHTTLMYRKDSFMKIGGYRIKGGGQDLDLLLQLGSVGQLANLDEFLASYTLSMTGLSFVNKNKYDAYLFALNDVKKAGLYKDYISIVEKSINKLHKLKSMKNSNSKYKRILLMLKISLLGKSFESYL